MVIIEKFEKKNRLITSLWGEGLHLYLSLKLNFIL